MQQVAYYINAEIVKMLNTNKMHREQAGTEHTWWTDEYKLENKLIQNVFALMRFHYVVKPVTFHLHHSAYISGSKFLLLQFYHSSYITQFSAKAFISTQQQTCRPTANLILPGNSTSTGKAPLIGNTNRPVLLCCTLSRRNIDTCRQISQHTVQCNNSGVFNSSQVE